MEWACGKCRILMGKPEGKSQLEDLGVEWVILLKRTSIKWSVRS
jgi:hypothetical protein